MNKTFRRKQYIVAMRFQLQYSGLILGLMLITAGICAYVVYYTTMVLLGEKLASVYPQGQLVQIVSTVNLRLLLSMVLLSPLVIVLGIFLSHKIAGPIYRMERFLNSMAAGDYSSHLILRKGDEFLMVADGINKLTDAVKTSVSSQRAHVNNILNETVTIREKLPDASYTKKLESEILELSKELDKYKLERPPK